MAVRAVIAGVCVAAALCGAGCARDGHEMARFIPSLRPQRTAPPVAPAPEPPPAIPSSCKPGPEHVDCAECATPGIWPVEHSGRRVSSTFGRRRKGGKGHKGIDMEAPRGTAVCATASGAATFVGWHGAYGKKIIIDHGNGIETVYAHLDCCLVEPGEQIRQGQKIGQVGNTGNATAFHLHYEVRKNGAPVNPEPWLP